jgi:hypothetical protein
MTEGKVFDLDALAGEVVEHTVKIGGRSFMVPGDLGIEPLLQLRKAGSSMVNFDEHPEESIELLRAFFVLIFGEENAAEVMRLAGTRHLSVLMSFFDQLYGLSEEGKAPGSSRASRRAGARSKATSNGSTASTSSRRASAKNGSAPRTSRG